MMSFLVTFAVFGLVWIPITLVIMSNKRRRKLKNLLFCIGFWFLLSGAIWCREQGNEERWNDGYCECGQHWELSAVEKTKSGMKTKYYTCSNCFAEIEINN